MNALQRRDEADLEEEDRDPERDDANSDRLDPEQQREAAGHEQEDQMAARMSAKEYESEKIGTMKFESTLEREDQDDRRTTDPRIRLFR